MSALAPTREYHVDPARLASGTWCHKQERQIGEGDISASYSAEKIGLEGRVRSPFKWQNALWVSVGGTSKGDYRAVQAYRLIPAKFFDGTPLSYHETVMLADGGRRGAEGFYHGMAVKWGKQDCVLIGPGALFLPSEEKAAPEQIDLLDLL